MIGNCLIVGAGMAGLTAAAQLVAGGWQVTLVDKGRGVGGRLATRRIGGRLFDHGAQFFTVRDERFRAAVAEWQAAGWVKPWFTLEGHTRYYAVGGMSALAKHLAAPFNVHLDTRVESISLIGAQWVATGANFSADTLVMTPPAAQTLALLRPLLDEMPAEIGATLSAVDYDPCFALLAALDGPSLIPPPGYARPESGPIEWIADNAMKGVCEGRGALTIHARAEFTRQHLESPKEEVAQQLLQAAAPYLDSSIVEWQLHRWLYSKPVESRNDQCLFIAVPAPLAIAGDAYAGSRVEGAFLSGLAAAARIASH